MEGEDIFRQFAEHCLDAFWVADWPGGQKRFVNAAYAELYCLNLAEVMADPHSWRRMVHPEDRERVFTLKDTHPRDVPFECEYRIVRPDGAIRWLRDRAFAIRDEAGQLVRIAGTAQDITERMLSEQALRHRERQSATLVNNLPDLIARMDRQYRHVFVSPSIVAAAQRPAEELLGRTHVELGIPEEQAAIWRQGLQRVFDTGETLDVEFDAPSPGGTIAFHGRLVAERGEDGSIDTVLVILRDITALKQEHTRRLETERRLQEGQRLESLGVLAGGIAHDFNNLLTGILGHASLAMLDLPDDASGVGHLLLIEEAASRAADLCRQLLAYAGRGRFVIQSVDLSALVQETAELVRLTVARRAELRFELAESLPTVRADAAQMQQVLMNLVLNAAESLTGSGGRVTVTTQVRRLDRVALANLPGGAELREGEYVGLEVSDNGSGMTEDVRARIFEPFYTTKFAGRGLGLSAVLGIARGHAGTLRVVSEPGRGSTFELLLPVG